MFLKYQYGKGDLYSSLPKVFNKHLPRFTTTILVHVRDYNPETGKDLDII